MFGSFRKKKPKNQLDNLIFALYGNPPPAKRANVQEATRLACEELLLGDISKSEVSKVAHELYESPIPYTTHDLALSTSMNFFQQPNYMPSLKAAQMTARLKMLEWLQSGLVAPMLVKSFEEKLYNLYKP